MYYNLGNEMRDDPNSEIHPCIEPTNAGRKRVVIELGFVLVFHTLEGRTGQDWTGLEGRVLGRFLGDIIEGRGLDS